MRILRIRQLADANAANNMRILQFGAVWCANCIYMKSVWDDIVSELEGLGTEYYDADDNAEELKKYGINDVPVFIFLDNSGKELMRLQGAQNKEELIKIIKEHIVN